MKIFDSRAAVPLLLAVVAAWPAAASPRWQSADPSHVWSFPRDHWAHAPYRLEWWYFTGHLESQDRPARRFGYQMTFFRIGLQSGESDLESRWSASNLLMAHAAITDKDRGEHLFSEVLFRGAEFLAGFGEYPDPEIAWSRGPVGTDTRWSLRWNGHAFDFSARDDSRGIAFELSTQPSKPLVLQGPNGYSAKAEVAGAASLYYSFTRLATAGTLSIDGASYRVRGESWMDKELSTSHLGDDQVGWDWFGLQLDDGRELMLYVLRRADGETDFARGTFVRADGAVDHLTGTDWRARSTATWFSPETDTSYPARWNVEIPSAGLNLDVRPDVAAQENVGELAGGLRYWEGAVTVYDEQGRSVGRGYVELTGYGEGNRPPI